MSVLVGVQRSDLPAGAVVQAAPALDLSSTTRSPTAKAAAYFELVGAEVPIALEQCLGIRVEVATSRPWWAGITESYSGCLVRAVHQSTSCWSRA